MFNVTGIFMCKWNLYANFLFGNVKMYVLQQELYA